MTHDTSSSFPGLLGLLIIGLSTIFHFVFIAGSRGLVIWPLAGKRCRMIPIRIPYLEIRKVEEGVFSGELLYGLWCYYFCFSASDLSYLIKFAPSMFGNLKIYSRTFALGERFFYFYWYNRTI